MRQPFEAGPYWGMRLSLCYHNSRLSEALEVLAVAQAFTPVTPLFFAC